MKKCKLVSMFIATVVIVSCLWVQPIYVSADDTLTRRVLVNVAQFKPTTGGSYDANFPVTNLTDGDPTTFTIPGASTDNQNGIPSPDSANWYQVDLLRRHRIVRIELFDRHGLPAQSGGRSDFEILASNYPDFSNSTNYTRLGGIVGTDNTLFPPGGPFVIELDGLAAYRYIHLRKTGGYYPAYGQLRVYAYQIVTEVSRHRPVTASSYADPGVGPGNAVSGVNGASSDAWVSDYYTGEFEYWTVDLGMAFPIGMIELEGRIEHDSEQGRRNFAIYGSNTMPDSAMLRTNAVPLPSAGMTRLSHLESPGETMTPFPMHPGVYRTTTNDTTAFRFITYKKTYANHAALGAFRAFVVNPDLLSVTAETNGIRLEFSDEMNVSTLTTANIRLLDGEIPVPFTVTEAAGHSCLLVPSIPIFGRQLTVQVTENVRNRQNTAIAPGFADTITIEIPRELQIQSINFTGVADVAVTVRNTGNVAHEFILILAAFNDQNTMTSINAVRQSIPVGGATTTVDLSLGATVPAGGRLEAFFLDGFESSGRWAPSVVR